MQASNEKEGGFMTVLEKCAVQLDMEVVSVQFWEVNRFLTSGIIKCR